MPLDYNDFAEQIKQKYPEYKDVDNYKLATAMVQKYPEYKNQVDLKKKEVSQSTLVKSNTSSGRLSSTTTKPTVSSSLKDNGQYTFPGQEGVSFKKEANNWYRREKDSYEYKQIKEPARINNLEKRALSEEKYSFETAPAPKQEKAKFQAAPKAAPAKPVTQTEKVAQKAFTEEFQPLALDSPEYLKRKKESESIESKVGQITPDLINDNEGDVVPRIKDLIKDYPYLSVSESGIGYDELEIVNNATGEREKINLENWTSDRDQKEAKRLQGFLDIQMNSKDYVDQYKKVNYIKSQMSDATPTDRIKLSEQLLEEQGKLNELKTSRYLKAGDDQYKLAALYDKNAKENIKTDFAKLQIQTIDYSEKVKSYSDWTKKINEARKAGKITDEQYQTEYAPKLAEEKRMLIEEKDKISKDFAQTRSESDSIDNIAANQYAIESERGNILTGASFSALQGAENSLRFLLETGDFQDGEFKGLLTEAAPGSISETYTSAEGRNSLEQIVFGLANSGGSALVGAAIGSPFLGLYASSYVNMKDQMSSPAFKDVPEWQKILMSGVYGGTVGVLEKYGVSKWFQKTPAGRGLTNWILKKTISELGEDASSEAIELAIKKNLNAAVANGLIQITSAGLVEGSTELAQEGADMIYKDVFNKLSEKKYFENPKSWAGVADRLSQSFILGFAGGAGMNSISQATEIGSNELTKAQIDNITQFINDPELQDTFKMNLKDQILSGQITKDDAKRQVERLNELEGTIKKIPENVDRYQAFKLLNERDDIQKEIAGKDPALVAVQTERINAINEELKTISQNAFQEQTTSEVSIQPGAEVGGEVAKGESKAGSQVIAEEVSKAKEEVDQYIADAGSEARIGSAINPLVEKMAAAENIDDADIDSAIETIFNEVDSLEKSDQYSPETKKAISEKLLNIADKLDNYEFRTTTETVETTKAGAATATRKTSEAVQKINAERYFNGVTANVNGEEVTFTDNKGRVEATMPNGEVVVLDTPTISVVEDGFEFDENGALEAVTVTDRLGNNVRFTGDIALDLAIRDRENKLGVVEQAEFETAYQEVKKNYVKEPSGKTGQLPVTEGTTSPQVETTAEVVTEEKTVEAEPTTKAPVSKTENELTERNARTMSVKYKRNPIVRAAINVLKALPGVKIYLHENADQYSSALANKTGESKQSIEKSAGSYIDGEIHLDMSKADLVTLLHEAFHHAIEVNGIKGKYIIDMAKGLRDIIKDKDRLAELDEFVSRYEEETDQETLETRADEFVAQLGGILAENQEELTTTGLTKFMALINRIFKKLGLGNVFTKASTSQDAVNFINAITRGLNVGENINNIGINGVFDTSNAKRKKSILSTGLFERYPDNPNTKVEENVPLSRFNGKRSNVFESDRMTGAYIADDKGNKVFNFFGGIFFPRITGKWWASSSLSTATSIANNSKRDADGYIYGTPIIMSPGSQMSNNDMLLATLEFMKMDVMKKNSGVSKPELMTYIEKAFEKKKITGKKNILKNALKRTNSIEQIFDELEYVLFQEDPYIKDRSGNYILTDTRDRISKLTFEERKEIVSGILGDPKVMESKFPSAGSISQMSDKFTEPETLKSKKLWDIVAVYRTKGNLVAKPASKTDEFYHKSYPYEILAVDENGNPAEVEVFMLDGAYNLTEAIPEMTKSSGDVFTWAEHEEAIKSGKYKSEAVALNQYGRTSKLSRGSGEISIPTETTPSSKRKKQIIGKSAELSDNTRRNLELAKAIEMTGADQNTIFVETGWFRGTDGKWKYEVPDEITFMRFAMSDLKPKLKEGTMTEVSANQIIGKNLLLAYPQLSDITFEFTRGEGRNYYNPTDNIIRLSVDETNDEIYSTYVHEVQHAIQYIENFARGGNKETAGNTKKGREASDRLNSATENAAISNPRLYKQNVKTASDYVSFLLDELMYEMSPTWRRKNGYNGEISTVDRVKKFINSGEESFIQDEASVIELIDAAVYHHEVTGLRGYFKLAGEVESRNVEKRLKMGQEERKSIVPNSTEDVAAEDQILYFGQAKDREVSTPSKPSGRKKQLVAPNGKPSNLNDKQWEQVRTPEFKKWFGDWENDPKNASKVVDENGEPLVVYHGSRTSFEEFDSGVTKIHFRPTALDGFWFTSSKNNAQYFGKNLMELFLNIKNPIDFDVQDMQSIRNVVDGFMDMKYFDYKKGLIKNSDLTQSLKARIYKNNNDGVIYRNMKDMILSDNFQAFEPNQIKSATENVGTFSAETPKIKFQKAPKILGQKPTVVIVNDEAKALIDQIKLEVRAQREQKKAHTEVRKSISDSVKALVKKGSINLKQASTVISTLNRVNFDNPEMVSRFNDYVAKVFDKAEYIDKVERATRMKKKIKANLKGSSNPFAIAAKGFSQLEPKWVENIDDYIMIAQAVYDSVKKSAIRKGVINWKQEADFQMVAEYVFDEEARQTEMLLGNLRSLYERITGESSDGVPADVMQAELKDLKVPEDFSADVLDQIEEKLAEFEQMVEDTDPEVVKKAASIDPTIIPTKEAIRILDALDTYFTNGSTAGLDDLMNLYIGKENAIKFKERGKPLRSFGSKLLAQTKFKQLTQFNMILERKFRTKEAALAYKKESGIQGIENGANKAEAQAMRKQREYTSKFGKIKGFNSAENIFQRGALANLLRTMVASEELQQAEFDRNITILRNSVDTLSKGNANDQKKAKVYKKVLTDLGVFRDDVDIEMVLSKAKKENIDAVNFVIDMFGEIVDPLSDLALGMYNQILTQDVNYTPYVYKMTDLKKTFGSNQDNSTMDFFGVSNYANQTFDKNKAGVLMPITRPKTLQKGMHIDLDFDNNMFRQYRNALVDLYTAGPIRQFEGFFNSEENEKILGSNEDQEIIKSAMIDYVRTKKGSNFITDDGLGFLNKLSDYMAQFGAARALVGIGQFVNQFSSGMTNTIVNAGEYIRPGDFSKDVFEFIANSGRSIANVGGDEILVAMGDIDKSIERADLNNRPDQYVLKFIAKENMRLFNVLVAYPDAIARKLAWMAYYRKSMVEQGLLGFAESVDTTKPVNDTAADYAQLMVDRNMDATDATLRGSLFRNRNASVKILRSIFMPFASFGINQKNRMWNDLNSLASGKDMVTSVRSIVSIAGELVVYNAIRYYIAKTILGAALSLLGYDDDDQEELYNKLLNNAKLSSFSKLFTDIISPLPLLDNQTLNLANKAMKGSSLFAADPEAVQKYVDKLKQKGNLTDEEIEEKKKAFEEKNARSFYVDTEANIGTLGIQYEKAVELMDLVSAWRTGEFVDDNNNERFLSKESREKLTAPLMMKFAATVYGTRELDQIANKSFKLVKDAESMSKTQQENFDEVKKELDRDLTELERSIIKKKRTVETAIDEINFIKKNGGLNKEQGSEYLKLLDVIPKPSPKMIIDIQNGQKAADIIKKNKG